MRLFGIITAALIALVLASASAVATPFSDDLLKSIMTGGAGPAWTGDSSTPSDWSDTEAAPIEEPSDDPNTRWVVVDYADFGDGPEPVYWDEGAMGPIDAPYDASGDYTGPPQNHSGHVIDVLNSMDPKLFELGQ